MSTTLSRSNPASVFYRHKSDKRDTHTVSGSKTYRVKKFLRYTNSQCLSSSTLIVAHRVLRPLTACPSITTVFSDPITAKGIMFYASKRRKIRYDRESICKWSTWTYPDAFIQLNLFCIQFLGIEWVELDCVLLQLRSYLCRFGKYWRLHPKD